MVPFLINPRSASRAAILPLAMLAAISLLEVILPAIEGNTGPKPSAQKLASKLFLGYLLIYLLANNYGLAVRMAENHLRESDRQAMAWISLKTPGESKFLILTGEANLMREPVLEWFPALSDRTSQTTLQGKEWLWGDKFIQAIVAYQGIRDCLGKGLSCLDSQTQALGISYEYVYLEKAEAQGILREMKAASGYKIVYENEGVVILQRAE
jgi:hypothetical protein